MTCPQYISKTHGNFPLLWYQFMFTKIKLLHGGHRVNHWAILKRKLKHVVSRVPAGCHITGHHSRREIEGSKHGIPSRKEYCRGVQTWALDRKSTRLTP